MNEEFSKRLAAARKKNGISQKQAAATLGVSQALLSHYERGIRECGLDFVAKVSDYYGVSADYLLGITQESGNTAYADRRYMVRALQSLLDYVEKASNTQLDRFSQTFIELSLYRIITIIMGTHPESGNYSYADMRNDRMADGYMQLCIAKLMKLARNDALGLSAKSSSADSIKKSFGWDAIQKIVFSSEKLLNELNFDKKTTE